MRVRASEEGNIRAAGGYRAGDALLAQHPVGSVGNFLVPAEILGGGRAVSPCGTDQTVTVAWGNGTETSV